MSKEAKSRVSGEFADSELRGLKSDLGGGSGEEDERENEKEGHKESLRVRLRFNINTMPSNAASWRVTKNTRRAY